MPAQLFIACVTDYSGGLYCARAECVGTYTHTINTYTSYFYHFDTPLQTVNQFIPTFIHSFVISFTISFTHSNFHFRSIRFIHSIHSQFRPTQFIWSFHNFDQSDSFGHSTISINPIPLVIPQFRSIRFIRSSAILTNSFATSFTRFIQSILFLVGVSPTEVAHDHPWRCYRGFSSQVHLIDDYSIHAGEVLRVVRDRSRFDRRFAIRFHGRRSDMTTLGSLTVVRLAQ